MNDQGGISVISSTIQLYNLTMEAELTVLTPLHFECLLKFSFYVSGFRLLSYQQSVVKIHREVQQCASKSE